MCHNGIIYDTSLVVKIVGRLPVMAEFDKKYAPEKMLLIGEQGIPLERFLLEPVKNWLVESPDS